LCDFLFFVWLFEFFSVVCLMGIFFLFVCWLGFCFCVCISMCGGKLVVGVWVGVVVGVFAVFGFSWCGMCDDLVWVGVGCCMWYIWFGVCFCFLFWRCGCGLSFLFCVGGEGFVCLFECFLFV